MGVHPYSLHRFVELAEVESRSGRHLARIVPEVGPILLEMKELREEYWDDVRGLDKDSDERALRREEYAEDHRELRAQRQELLEESLHGSLCRFERNLSEEKFTWQLAIGPRVGGRQTFRIGGSPEITFPAREANALLRESVGTQMVSRNGTVRALKQALMRRYAHAVYRIDIRSFFASIPHDKLKARVNGLKGLDQITRKIVEQLLIEYRTLTGADKGVPPGVGLSSQLSELYLKDFDQTMRSFPGVLFFARYVDDVILVLERGEDLENAARKIDALLSELALEVNKQDDKFSSIISDDSGDYGSDSVEYLGYSFSRSNGVLHVGLTARRAERRKKRIEIAFDKWLVKNPTRRTANSGDEGMLIDRIRFLASNTVLQNSKDNVAVGIYFSNSALDKGSSALEELDAYLRTLITEHRLRVSSRSLKRLRAISFKTGFEERTFVRFDQERLKRIVKCWSGV